jgi:hypothetical protein
MRDGGLGRLNLRHFATNVVYPTIVISFIVLIAPFCIKFVSDLIAGGSGIFLIITFVQSF